MLKNKSESMLRDKLDRTSLQIQSANKLELEMDLKNIVIVTKL